jgi:hypothetical protein
VLRARVLSLTADADGSAVGTVGVPPSRYAGVHYVLTPDTHTPDLTISNLGRTVFSKGGCANSDGVQELTPPNEKLVNGDVVVSWGGGAAGERYVVDLYFDYNI